MDRLSNSVTTISLWLLAGVTLLTDFIVALGTRFFEDPFAMALLALVSARIRPTALVGLLLLGTYVVVNELDRDDTANKSSISRSHLLGIGVAAVYIGGTLAFWFDPRQVINYVTHLIVDTSRFIYTSPLTRVLDPISVRNIEFALRSSLRNSEVYLFRSPDRDIRWPLYLFVSYVSISELTEFTGWKYIASRTVRVHVYSVMAIIVLLYGLIIGHNFFPRADALPWRSLRITIWLLAHTALSGIVLFVLRRTTAPKHTDRIPSTLTSLVVFLLLGMTVAVLDSLSPLPELLLLGVAGVILADNFTSATWSDAVSPKFLDIEARFVSGLARAWRHPTRLFPILVIFQGFWWGGHSLWLVLFSVGGPLSGTSSMTPVALALYIVVALPLIAATVYSMAFWFLEFYRHTFDRTRSTTHRLPDLLTAPTLIIASYISASHLFDIHPIASLLSLVGVFAGTYGMWCSIKQARSDTSKSSLVARHAVPIGFLVQAGGLTLVFSSFDFAYRSPGIPSLLLLGTLGPLYFFPRIRERGIRFISPSVAAPLLIVITATFATGYLLSVGTTSLFNDGFLAFASIVLAISRIDQINQE